MARGVRVVRGVRGWRRGLGGLVVPDREEDFAADPVELFFDLVFVVAFSQLVGRLVHEPTASGLADSALLFLLLWLPWTQLTWSANAVPGNARNVRAVVLVATVASVPMAAASATAFGEGGTVFAVSLAVIYATALSLLVIGYDRSSAEFRSSVRYAVPNLVAMALLVAGSLLDGGARVGTWVGALLVVVLATVRAGTGDWVMRPGHFAERHGLILIVALGEVVLAIALPVLAALEEGDGLPGRTVAALAGAGAFAGLLWWGYFDRPQPAFERRAEALEGRERSRFARDVYTYLHAPIVAGVVLAAAALEEITLHPADPLPAEFRWMLLVGLVLHLAGIDAAVYRAYRMVPPERGLAAVVVAAALLAGGDLPGLALLVVVDVVLLVALVLEQVRVEVRPARRVGATEPVAAGPLAAGEAAGPEPTGEAEPARG